MFLARANDGVLPARPRADDEHPRAADSRSLGRDSEAHEQEERRLLHVAITRARLTFTATYAARAPDFGGGGAWSEQAPSQFFDELPSAVVRHVDDEREQEEAAAAEAEAAVAAAEEAAAEARRAAVAAHGSGRRPSAWAGGIGGIGLKFRTGASFMTAASHLCANPVLATADESRDCDDADESPSRPKPPPAFVPCPGFRCECNRRRVRSEHVRRCR